MGVGRGRRGGTRGARNAFALLAGAVALSACLGTHGILEERGRGVVRCYRVPYDTLWNSAESTLKWVGLVLERANRENGFLVARSYRPEVRDPEEMALEADQGERVAVFIESEGPDVWAVEVVSRPIFALDPTPRDWTDIVFIELEERLPASALDPDEDLAACTRAPM